MPDITILVTATTEKTSGLIASRDEQADALVAEIEQAIEGFEISSIGARSDSTYMVDSATYEVLDAKNQKKILAEFDEHVRAEAPPTAELTKELKSTRLELEGAQREITRLEQLVAKLREEESGEKSRVYQKDGYGADETFTYLKDGQYDSVIFETGDRWDDAFEVMHAREGAGVTIRFKGAGGVVVSPDSGNVVSVYPKGAAL